MSCEGCNAETQMRVKCPICKGMFASCCNRSDDASSWPHCKACMPIDAGLPVGQEGA